MGDEIWQETVRGATLSPADLALSGFDQVRSFVGNDALTPPISHLTGMHPTEAVAGGATFVMPVTTWLQSPMGTIIAGVIAVLADGPLGCAIQTGLPAATGYTTTELSINLVRILPREGQLVARGRVVHSGRQLALSEVYVTDQSGRLLAHGTSRCAVFAPGAGPRIPAPAFTCVPASGGWVPPFARPSRGEVVAQDVFAARNGLEIVSAHIAGDLPRPPMSHLFGMMPTAAEEGRCLFTMPASGWLASPTGFVEGGATACLADCALGGAFQTTVPAGSAFAPTDLRVQFLRPVPCDGGPLTADATVVHRGRGFAAARAELTNADGKLIALASAAAVILPGRRADLADVPAA